MTDNRERSKDQQIEELQARIVFLESELLHYKAKSYSHSCRVRELARENHDLKLEIKDMKFTRKFLTSEDAGRRFAESLLGGA